MLAWSKELAEGRWDGCTHTRMHACMMHRLLADDKWESSWDIDIAVLSEGAM
jgi:hypothetical protein